MYVGGMGIPAIAHAIGRSQCFVSGRLKKVAVQLRKPGNPNKERPQRRLSATDLELAVTRYIAGESASTIGLTGGLSKTTLLKEIKRRGIEIRLQARGEEDHIVNAYLSGLSVGKIEATIGCTKRRASNVLKSAGISLRERTRDKTPLSRTLACRRRAAAIARATPPWANKDQIRSIYAECRAISETTGKRHHVDHFFPLHSHVVCGLHVPENLRIISERANVAKKNLVHPSLLEPIYA